VVAYHDIDDALTRANATHFGLCASVWGTDTDRAAQIAARLDCGTAYINTHLTYDPDIPFGGHKSSGIGVEGGPWGIHSYTDLQVRHHHRT
jgi:acyl-CoA reductase-like NAD-dependent aldehyde dehydrogenase